MNGRPERPSLRVRLRSEHGVALPVAVSVLAVSGLLAGAAATAAITANSQSNKDRGAKRAVAAADAGLDVAVYRMNKFATYLTAAQPCVGRNATTGALFREAATGPNTNGVAGADWCAQQSETIGESSSFSYWVSVPVATTVGGQSVLQRKIVSTGTANSGAQRRTATAVSAPTGTPLFAFDIFSQEDFLMRGGARVTGNVRSNGNVISQGGSSICGNVGVGAGRQFRGGPPTCGGTTTQISDPYVMSPVVIPTSNDNGTLSGAGWNPSTRVLSSGKRTLTGSVYVFCKVDLSGGKDVEIPNDGTPVKIYIDAPENCPGVTNAGSVFLQGGSGFDNKSGDPTMLQIFMAGSTKIATTFQFKSSEDLEAVVYAPNSKILMEGAARLTGAMSAKSIEMAGAARFTWDPRARALNAPDLPLPVYTRQSWVECRAQGGANPDSNC